MCAPVLPRDSEDFLIILTRSFLNTVAATYEIIGADNRAHGPEDAAAVCRWIREGRASHRTMARRTGEEAWRPLASFPQWTGPLRGQPSLPPGQPPPAHSLAIGSMVLGIVALVFFPLGLVLGVPAVICGHVAWGAIGAEPEIAGGKGLVVAGLITGYLGIVVGALSLLGFVVMAVSIYLGFR
jgi:hypothetical protein